MTRLRSCFAILALGLLVAAISGCGGGSDEGSSENPRQVYQQTFSGSKDYSSGVLSLDLQISSEGANAGNLTVHLDGPFQSGGEGPISQFDLNATISGEGSSASSFDFDGELISTGTSGYVVKDGTAYAVDARSFKIFTQLYDGFSNGLQFPPVGLTSNLTNEGTTQVEGTDTIHVSGDLDPGRLVKSLQGLSKAAGRKVPGASQLEQLQSSIKQAHLDLYSGVDDRRVRRFVLDSESAVPAGSTDSNSSSAFRLDLTLSELGEAQTIEAPADTQPLNVLLAGGGSSGSSTKGAGSGQAGTRAYLDCLSAAQDQSAVEACNELVK